MTEKPRNGKFELVYSNRIHFAELSPMKIPVEVTKGEIIKLIFNLEYDGGEMNAEFSPAAKETGAAVEFKLKNFGTPFGTYVKEPIRIGRLNDQEIVTVFNVAKPKDGMPVLDLSVYLEIGDAK